MVNIELNKMLVFKLLDTLINEYNDYLTCHNIKPLMNLIETFVMYKKNHNTSLSAVTMFWNAADLIEKFQKLSAMVLILVDLNIAIKRFAEEWVNYRTTISILSFSSKISR